MTTLLPICEPAIERGEKVERTLPIRNVNRVVGTIAGSEITRKYGPEGLPDDTGLQEVSRALRRPSTAGKVAASGVQSR